MKSKRMSVVAAAAQHGDLNLDTIWTCWEEHEKLFLIICSCSCQKRDTGGVEEEQEAG